MAMVFKVHCWYNETMNQDTPMKDVPMISSNEAVSKTVYSAVWPPTEALVRQCMAHETEAMLDRHRLAHTKVQDSLHREFFTAWRQYAAATVDVDVVQFPHQYPCNGSSEAIREIIHTAVWNQQDLVVFDGDYEGYEVIAAIAGTRVHRVDRATWRATLTRWQAEGAPWQLAGRRAQWWVSQPSAIDGNIWDDFQDWLTSVSRLNNSVDVWVDLCYLGVTTRPFTVHLDHSCVAGVVFSLSKTMGAYYRRIGGCFSRDALPGLWGNGWFKNLDSLYLGTRWLKDPTFQGRAWQARLSQWQHTAMERALNTEREAFLTASIAWVPSDVALLMHADEPPSRATGLDRDSTAARWWAAAARGAAPTGRRLCLTPSFDFGEH